MEIEPGKLPPPPGMVASMIRGFDSVANHILVILPPVLLDLFLWLGPHLRLKTFFQPVIDNLPAFAKAFPASVSNVPAQQELFTSAVNQFNLFIVLRTFPVGVTSLLSLKMPAQNPFGTAVSVDAGSFLGIVGWFLLLALTGWLIGGMYYFWVSRVAVKLPNNTMWKAIQQTVLLSVIWLGFFMIFGLPLLLLFSVLSAISPFIGQVVLFIGALLLIWLIMPVFFSAHGIFTLQMDAMRAIMNSLRMVRFTLPTTGLFLLVFLLINQGMNYLWGSASQTTWWMLVGIAGHAFVSTALLAASFVYYRDINAWLAVVFEQLQHQPTSAKI